MRIGSSTGKGRQRNRKGTQPKSKVKKGVKTRFDRNVNTTTSLFITYRIGKINAVAESESANDETDSGIKDSVAGFFNFPGVARRSHKINTADNYES